MTQTQKLIEVALAIVSNWDDGFPVHGDEQIADDFRTALDAAKQEHRAEPETALSYVRDMVLNDRGPLEGMGMTNDQTNAMLAIIDAAPVAAQPTPEVPSVPFGYVVDLHEGTGLPPNLQFYGPGERYGSGFSHTPVYSGEQVAAMLEQKAEPIGYVHPDTLGLLKNYTHCAMFRPGDQTEGSIALYTHPPVQQATQQVAEKGACPVCGCEELDHRGIWTCRCPAQQAAQPAPVARGEPTKLQVQIDKMAEACGGLRSLARTIDLDVGYLSRLRSGEKEHPTDEVLAKLGLARSITYYEIDTHPPAQQAAQPAPEVPAGCLWAVTKGGHTICQPPKNWGKQPAPEVPVDESIADLARYIQILCRESKNDC